MSKVKTFRFDESMQSDLKSISESLDLDDTASVRKALATYRAALKTTILNVNTLSERITPVVSSPNPITIVPSPSVTLLKPLENVASKFVLVRVLLDARLLSPSGGVIELQAGQEVKVPLDLASVLVESKRGVIISL